MSNNQILAENQRGVEEDSFAGTNHIETPVYSPEIKSAEDVWVLLKHHEALDDGAPIVVPANTWRTIRSQPKFNDYRSNIERLVRRHPTLYRSPVELFRYRRPKKLVTYGLGDASSRTFYKKLREEKYDAALDLLPEFVQPFVEIQMERLLEVKGYDIPERYDGTLRTTSEAWTDDRANKGWPNYFAEIAKDAQRSPNAGVIPPVPVVTSSSKEYAIERTIGANHGMVRVCREVNEGRFGSAVYPYLHIYADYSILKNSSDNDRLILDHARQEIKNREEESSFTTAGAGVGYQGVVLSMTNLSSVWAKNATVRLQRFVENLSTIARSHNLPVMMPRSNWYGLYLTDFGVQSFSSLLNGNETYSQGGSGINAAAKYGKTPLYGAAVHPGVDDAFAMLRNTGGEVHPVSGLPSKPPTFDPAGDEWSEKLGDPREYRREFGKPRRLIHAQEAREVRSGMADGVHRPAREYLQKSENNDFS